MRILIVDDEPDILETVKELLETYFDGAAVAQASNGDEALDVLKHGRVDLIVTDYKMPGMDGIQFLQAAEGIAPGTPHILVTAYGREGLGAAARAGLKPSEILDKPFEIDEFLGAIDQAFASHA